MKKLILVVVALAASSVAPAAPRPQVVAPQRFTPLALKNKLVFTRIKTATTSTTSPTEEVWTMSPDGTHQKRVWRVPKGYGRFGGFNNSGTQALSYNAFNLYLYNLRTRRLRRLFVHSSGWGTYIAFPSFSHDGKRVVFSAGGASDVRTSSVYVVDLKSIPTKATMEPRRVSVAPSGQESNELYEPKWSPDGQRLAVSVGVHSNVDPEMFSEAWKILTMNSDGSSPRLVTSNQSPLADIVTFDKEPSFSPGGDGQTIAFVRRLFHRGKGESNDIWFADVAGKNERRVTSYEEAAKQAESTAFKNRFYNRISNLFFSADGQRIAFNQTGSKNGIYLFNIADRKVKWVADGSLVQWVW